MTAINLVVLIEAALLSGAIVLFAGALRFLTISGAVAAFLVGFVIFGFGGIGFAVPLLTFFFSSSLLSVLFRLRKRDSSSHYQKRSCRDAGQVLANGGVAVLLTLFFFRFPVRLTFMVFLSSLAAVNADTWATEIGVLSPGKPRLLTSWKKVEAGTSGAISWLGILASLAGSAAIYGSSVFYWNYDAAEMISVIWAGFMAALLDSILGASLQRQYCCVKCGQRVETAAHCGAPAEAAHGFRWINNDVVNLITALAGAIFGWILLRYYAYPS